MLTELALPAAFFFFFLTSVSSAESLGDLKTTFLTVGWQEPQQNLTSFLSAHSHALSSPTHTHSAADFCLQSLRLIKPFSAKCRPVSSSPSFKPVTHKCLFARDIRWERLPGGWAASVPMQGVTDRSFSYLSGGRSAP